MRSSSVSLPLPSLLIRWKTWGISNGIFKQKSPTKMPEVRNFGQELFDIPRKCKENPFGQTNQALVEWMTIMKQLGRRSHVIQGGMLSQTPTSRWFGQELLWVASQLIKYNAYWSYCLSSGWTLARSICNCNWRPNYGIQLIWDTGPSTNWETGYPFHSSHQVSLVSSLTKSKSAYYLVIDSSIPK